MSAYPEASFIASAHRPRQFLADEGREVAFAGRSNAGKSSAINAILGRRGLARTSKTPGRTQLVNFFSVGPGKRITDLPGYGYARVPPDVRRHWGELMDAYFRQRRSLAGLFLVMDIRHPLTEFDQQMLAWAEAADCPVRVLLTKCDKVSRGKGTATRHSVVRALGGGAGVQLFSALRGVGVDEARGVLDDMLGLAGKAGPSGA
ncbi:MAG: ribosome biogenesis GTP-binding protein YihA/YsxC [Gammaproteobacteria bacterium]